MWGIKLTFVVIFLQMQLMLACKPMTCEQKCSYMCKWPVCMGKESNSLDCEGCAKHCAMQLRKKGECSEEVLEMGKIMQESVKIFFNRMIDGYLGDEEMITEEYYSSSSGGKGMYVVPKKYKIKLIIQSQKRNVPLTHVILKKCFRII